MSNAPRTRSPMEYSRPATEFEVMQQEHIEQLERENAELKKLIEQMKAGLSLIAARIEKIQSNAKNAALIVNAAEHIRKNIVTLLESAERAGK